jgi:uncharacterized membrane protein YcjF (UPF0283 family)
MQIEEQSDVMDECDQHEQLLHSLREKLQQSGRQQELELLEARLPAIQHRREQAQATSGVLAAAMTNEEATLCQLRAQLCEWGDDVSLVQVMVERIESVLDQQVRCSMPRQCLPA